MAIDIEQLRKDMEAGTQPQKIKAGVILGGNAWSIDRIEHLEREYLALREAADALADVSTWLSDCCQLGEIADWENGNDPLSKVNEALAAYRKATE